MPLFQLTVAYNGTRFSGMQRQVSNEHFEREAKRPHWDSQGKRKKNKTVTIQHCLEEALLNFFNFNSAERNDIQAGKKLLVGDLSMRFASRTDKGVHARGQVVAVELPLDKKSCLAGSRRGINSRLPNDISIEKFSLAKTPNFVPRENVNYKIYSYTIKFECQNEASQKSPLGPQGIRTALDSPILWLCPWTLNESKVEEYCKRLSGRHNYNAFVHKTERLFGSPKLNRGKGKRSNVMTIDRIQWTSQVVSTDPDGHVVILGRWEFQAQGFRRSMVRNFVGFLVDIMRGQVDVDRDVEGSWDGLWTDDEKVAALVCAAPASGLCLERIVYENMESNDE